MMEKNKYWDEHGRCRACKNPLEMHAPRDFKNRDNGVKCFFSPKRELLPEIKTWLRPLLIEGIREFSKSSEDDSLIERTELTNAILEHRCELSEAQAKASREIAELREKNAEQLSEARTYHNARIKKLGHRMDAKDDALQQLKDQLEAQREEFQKEIAQICAENAQALAEIDQRHQTALEYLDARHEEDKKKGAAPKPPPVPIQKTKAAVPPKPASIREITLNDLAKLPPITQRRPLPGLPQPRLKVVIGGLK